MGFIIMFCFVITDYIGKEVRKDLYFLTVVVVFEVSLLE